MPTIDLQKKSLKVVLEKKALVSVKARVGLVLDITGSMRTMYKDGTVQKTVERILAIASQFDDDGLLDIWVYDNEFSRLKPVAETDFDGYVNREILTNGEIHKFGRNDELPVIKDVLRKYTEEDPSPLPAFIVFVNDGGCKKNIKTVIQSSSKQPVFWQFVGIGNGNFDFLQTLDTMEGRFVDNANFLHVPQIDKISDHELYDALLNEFPAWLKEAKDKGVLSAVQEHRVSSHLSEQNASEASKPAEKPQNKKSFIQRLFGK